MTVKDIPLSEIKADPDLMMRDGLDKALVVEYRENLDIILEGAPIDVWWIDPYYLLSDGFHRLQAARLLDKQTIPARVHQGSPADAHAAACLANLRHGKPLKPSERERAVKEYIKLKVKWSNRRIADEIGISDMTIGRYRRVLEADGEIEPQEVRKGKDDIKRRTATAVAVPPDPFETWFDEHVICGDAFEIMPTVERKFDLVIVDPPYGITTHDWDLRNKHELLAFTRRWLNQILGLLKPTGRLFVFWSREYMFELKPLIDEVAQAYPLHFGGIIVWHFRNVQSQPDSRRRYKLGWEPVFYYYGLEAIDLNFPKTEITGEKWEGEIQSDVWVFSIPQENFKEDKRIHPTQKPLGLCRRIIETASHRGDLVLDPFAGSGTVGHAAMLTGREFLLIEQEPQYCEAIRGRLKPIFKPGI